MIGRASALFARLAPTYRLFERPNLNFITFESAYATVDAAELDLDPIRMLRLLGQLPADVRRDFADLLGPSA